MSAADYVAYDANSTDDNWRAPGGYGALIARSFPANVSLRLDTPVESIAIEGQGGTAEGGEDEHDGGTSRGFAPWWRGRRPAY